MQKRWKLSSAERADMWKRWRTGQSLNAIGRALGKSDVVIQFLLARHGGIAPRVRRRPPAALALAEREGISRGIASGQSLRAIGRVAHIWWPLFRQSILTHPNSREHISPATGRAAARSCVLGAPCFGL